MSQQSETQKDTDTSTKNEQAYGTGKKPDVTGVKTPVADFHEPMGVDVPSPKTPANIQADAKQDATPNENPAPINADQSLDA